MDVLYLIENYQASISSLSQIKSTSFLAPVHMLTIPPSQSVSVEEILLLLRQLLHCPVVLRPFQLLRDLSLESVPFFLVLHENFK